MDGWMAGWPFFGGGLIFCSLRSFQKIFITAGKVGRLGRQVKVALFLDDRPKPGGFSVIQRHEYSRGMPRRSMTGG